MSNDHCVTVKVGTEVTGESQINGLRAHIRGLGEDDKISATEAQKLDEALEELAGLAEHND